MNHDEIRESAHSLKSIMDDLMGHHSAFDKLLVVAKALKQQELLNALYCLDNLAFAVDELCQRASVDDDEEEEEPDLVTEEFLKEIGE